MKKVSQSCSAVDAFKKEMEYKSNPDETEYWAQLSPSMFIHQKSSNLLRSDANYIKFSMKYFKPTFKKYYFPSSDTF